MAKITYYWAQFNIQPNGGSYSGNLYNKVSEPYFNESIVPTLDVPFTIPKVSPPSGKQLSYITVSNDSSQYYTFGDTCYCSSSVTTTTNSAPADDLPSVTITYYWTEVKAEYNVSITIKYMQWKSIDADEFPGGTKYDNVTVTEGDTLSYSFTLLTESALISDNRKLKYWNIFNTSNTITQPNLTPGNKATVNFGKITGPSAFTIYLSPTLSGYKPFSLSVIGIPTPQIIIEEAFGVSPISIKNTSGSINKSINDYTKTNNRLSADGMATMGALDDARNSYVYFTFSINHNDSMSGAIIIPNYTNCVLVSQNGETYTVRSSGTVLNGANNLSISFTYKANLTINYYSYDGIFITEDIESTTSTNNGFSFAFTYQTSQKGAVPFDGECDFKNWALSKKSSSGSSTFVQTYSSYSSIPSSLSVYAAWEEWPWYYAKLEWDLRGGTTDYVSLSASGKCRKKIIGINGAEVPIVIPKLSPKKDGTNSFSHYQNINTGISSDTYLDGDTYYVNSKSKDALKPDSATIYAVYNVNYYGVAKFDNNGFVVSNMPSNDIIIAEGKDLADSTSVSYSGPDETPTYTGENADLYEFVGWNRTKTLLTDELPVTLILTSQSKLSPTPFTFYAIFKQMVKYYFTVSFDTMGGNKIESVPGKPYPLKYDVGKVPSKATISFTVETPTKKGYEFKGWLKEKTSPEVLTDNKIEVVLDQNIDQAAKYEQTVTVYAKWSPITWKLSLTYNKNTTVSVTNMPNPTTITKSQTYTDDLILNKDDQYEFEITMPETEPERTDDYWFSEWNTVKIPTETDPGKGYNSGKTYKFVGYNTSYPNKGGPEKITLYAQWVEGTLAYIWDNGKWVKAIPYIWDNNEWVKAQPRIFNDETKKWR